MNNFFVKQAHAIAPPQAGSTLLLLVWEKLRIRMGGEDRRKASLA